MVTILQLFGLAFAGFMLYVSFVSYKKNILTKLDISLWSSLWFVFAFAIMFPNTLNILMESLLIPRATDFFTIASVLFLFSLGFVLFRRVRLLENKLTQLVQDLAKSNPKKK